MCPILTKMCAEENVTVFFIFQNRSKHYWSSGLASTLLFTVEQDIIES